jgi:hypothetical protein
MAWEWLVDTAGDPIGWNWNWTKHLSADSWDATFPTIPCLFPTVTKSTNGLGNGLWIRPEIPSAEI